MTIKNLIEDGAEIGDAERLLPRAVTLDSVFKNCKMPYSALVALDSYTKKLNTAIVAIAVLKLKSFAVVGGSVIIFSAPTAKIIMNQLDKVKVSTTEFDNASAME